jgi:predicted GH43/DUF377 family glycosyl hydrolase
MYFLRKYFFLILFFILAQDAFTQEIWNKYPDPVLSKSGQFPNWKGLATGDAFVMQDNDTLKMWFSGVGWLNANDNCPHVRLGYAWSLDGITWTEYNNNPVLDISADTSQFDADGIETPTVIKDLNAPAGERYKLWYAGRKSICSPVNDHQFGYAYSSNGIDWNKYAGNPVLSPGDSSSWFNGFISSPCVIFDNGIYKMWFTAPDLVLNGQATDGKGNIGYATSIDGINWNVNASPVLIAGEQNNWDSASIAEPSVVKVGSVYHLFYSALDQWTIENFQVGYAFSTDGITWTKSPQNPVLTIGNNNEWDRFWASHPTVIYDSLTQQFNLWYTGRDTAEITGLTGHYWDIGYAESDFITPIANINKNSFNIKVFPNPVKDKIFISLATLPTLCEINVFNSFGVKIKSIAKQQQQLFTFDMSELHNGIYLIQVTVNSNNVVFYKVIKD